MKSGLVCVYYYDTTSKKEEKSTRIGVSPRYTNKKRKTKARRKEKKQIWTLLGY